MKINVNVKSSQASVSHEDLKFGKSNFLKIKIYMILVIYQSRDWLLVIYVATYTNPLSWECMWA